MEKMEQELLYTKQLLEFHPKTAITIISNGRVVSIPIADITHISKYGTKTCIHTMTDTCKTHLSLQEIMKDLPVNDFFRVHRSHIVSVKRILGTTKKKIIVGEQLVPLSDYYRVAILARLRVIIDREYYFMEKNMLIAYEPVV